MMGGPSILCAQLSTRLLLRGDHSLHHGGTILKLQLVDKRSASGFLLHSPRVPIVEKLL